METISLSRDVSIVAYFAERDVGSLVCLQRTEDRDAAGLGDLLHLAQIGRLLHPGMLLYLPVASRRTRAPLRTDWHPSIVVGILPLVLLTGCLARKYDVLEANEYDADVEDGLASEYRDGGRDSSLQSARSDGGRPESRGLEAGIPDVMAVDTWENLPADAPTNVEGQDAPVVLPPDGGTDTPIQVSPSDARIEAAAVKTDVLPDTNRITNPDVSRDLVVLDVSPDQSPDTALPPLLDAPIDVPPTAGCTIGGTLYPSGVKSDDVCLVCAPAVNPGAWSNNADNTPCPTGYCQSGACTDGCLIGTTFYRTAAVNTGVNPCQSCQPSVSPTGWSPLPAGTDCPGGVCNAGQCAVGCWLGDGFVGSGDRKSDNQCQVCQPSVNPKAWQTLSNGEGCGTGKVCSGTGTCSDGCWLGGTLVPTGPGSAPDHDCQECQPLVSTSQWQPRAEGTYCGTGTQFCSAGSCQTGRWIGGAFYASDTINPANQCEICSPSLSLSSWVQRGVQDCSIITAGQHYTCTVVGGDARCWGANGSGQLGDNSTTRRTSPVQVVGLTSGVRAISSAGDSYHTCALVNGGVQCWGRNGRGELGNDPMASSLVPVAVSGLSSGVIGLSVGGNHTQDKANAADKAQILAIVGYSTAGAATVAALVFWLTDSPQSQPSAQAGIGFSCLPSPNGLACQGRF